MSSTFIKQAIAEHSARHSQLLKSIEEVEGVPAALKEQIALVEELQSQLRECEASVAKLFEKTRDQRRNADPGVIPNPKIFSSLFRGRREKEREKERERERQEEIKRAFEEAMKEETKERERKTALEQELSRAQSSKADLLEKVKEYDDLMGRIEALYSLIFSGPTPGYPREDELEQQVQASRSVVERTQGNLNTENEALDQLNRAEKALRECQSKMKDAIYWATASMLAGGRSAESKEAASLRLAHSLAGRAQTLARDAQHYSAHVRPIDSPSIARELPVRGENDTEFHEVLKSIAADLSNAYNQLVAERRAAIDRVEALRTAASQAEQTVADHKKELYNMRKSIFLEIVSKLKSGEIEEPTDADFDGQDAPPSYEYQAQTQPQYESQHSISPFEMAKRAQSQQIRRPVTSPVSTYSANSSSTSGPSSPVNSPSHSLFGDMPAPLSSTPSRRRPLPPVPVQSPQSS